MPEQLHYTGRNAKWRLTYQPFDYKIPLPEKVKPGIS